MQKINSENKSTPKPTGLKNIVTVLILLALIALLLVNIFMLNKLSKRLSQDGEPKQEILLKVNPALDKIKCLRQQIIDREVIKDDCLIGIPIDNQLKEDIGEYNQLVSDLKGFFSEQAIKTLAGILELEIEDGIYAPDYIDIPSDVREYAEIIADLSLYRNCTDLLKGDSRLAFIIYSEGGGSAGMWPYFWHTEYLRGHEDKKEHLDRLFDLVERIITFLDNAYENIINQQR